jgi:glycerol-3-phosphate dehydrogenase
MQCCTAALQDGSGQVTGVHCRDKQSGRKFDVHARVVINATGASVCHIDLLLATPVAEKVF